MGRKAAKGKAPARVKSKKASSASNKSSNKSSNKGNHQERKSSRKAVARTKTTYERRHGTDEKMDEGEDFDDELSTESDSGAQKEGLWSWNRPIWNYLEKAKRVDFSEMEDHGFGDSDPWVKGRVLHLERVGTSSFGTCKPFNDAYEIPDHQLRSIYDHLYNAQSNFRAMPYMARQEAVNAKMRTILIDWLAEVHHKFKLQPCILWLTVNILDRYLEKESVKRVKLQLVGVTSLFIACKCYNNKDGKSLGVIDSVYITDNAYKAPEVTETELKMLAALEFQVFVPTGYHFLERYLSLIDAVPLVANLAKFYAERNLQEYDMLDFMPHHFAAAALYTALVYHQQCHQTQSDGSPLSELAWPPVLQRETGLTQARLVLPARMLLGHVNESPSTSKQRKLNSVWKKYTTPQYLNVAQLPLPSI